MKSVMIAALAATAMAAPAALQKRDNIDGVILNYALTLEHLEAAFYSYGLSKFSAQDMANAGFSQNPFYKNLKHISKDEHTHVAVLTAALKAAGQQPVKACQYDFGTLTPESFIQTAAVLEGVGIAAYTGAANLITNRQYLTEAASILGVEARHSAYLRSQINSSPFPQPFDNALDFNEVYSLAAPFIKSCPKSNPILPVKAFPKLILQGSGIFERGAKATFAVQKGTKMPNQMFIAYPLVSGNIFVKATLNGDNTISAVIPKGEFGPMGQSYAILVSSQGTITDANTVAGPAIIQVLSPYLGGK